MLLFIAILFIIIWVAGLLLHLLGAFIYIFLILALISFITHLLRRPV